MLSSDNARRDALVDAWLMGELELTDAMLDLDLRSFYTARRRRWGAWATARHLMKLGYDINEALWVMGLKGEG